MNLSSQTNNITVHCNGTSQSLAFTTGVERIGNYTTQVRVTYGTGIHDSIGTANNVASIVGVVIIIGTILLIVGLVYQARKGGGY